MAKIRLRDIGKKGTEQEMMLSAIVKINILDESHLSPNCSAV